MKDLSPDDRPREKLAQHGVAALGDNELVALVIGHGSRHAGALGVANSLMAAYGGIHGLARCAPDELSRVPGIGPARAAQIAAALELGRRTLVKSPRARLQLGSARDAELLDTKHRVMRTTVLVSGTLNSTIVEPRDVFREAALGGAAAIVVFHNHPSGDPAPSTADVELTRRLAAAGMLLGIHLVDHVVLGDVRYFSFRERGEL